MALIPTQQVEPRETLSVRIDRTVHEQLKKYAEFIDSPKDYVLTQALERLFRSDKSFQAWLTTNKRNKEPQT